MQTKDKLVRQLNCFKVLSDRSKKLSEQDEMIDIMAEAEKLRTLTKLANDKYLAYCNTIASRLTTFSDEMVSKCCNFSAEVGSFVGKTTNAWVHPQEQAQMPQTQPRQAYEGGNWLTRANRTLDRPQYRHTQNEMALRHPKWLKSFTSDFYS